MMLPERIDHLISAKKIENFARIIVRDPLTASQIAKLTGSDDPKTGDNATWVFAKAAERRNHGLQSFAPELFVSLCKTKRSAQRRNLLKFFVNCPLPDEIEGGLFSHCLDYLSNPSEAIAVKCLALTLAAMTAGKHPELLRELKLVQNILEHEDSPAIRARLRNLNTAGLL